ncbi:EndoU domain-containing protein [Actinomadura opuntiae]|uniref:EndoU domain-containing protein n=1 Tax=Actinomadura sp. OS1-43 TaxID=604315 RepID=UPI00255A95A7|nr:EndoU domain-containing protein [Actinomadura sp. OS1-43]MDL4816853.1 EndoU domain-containing protein [Actinomadura sp. OS1-43]
MAKGKGKATAGLMGEAIKFLRRANRRNRRGRMNPHFRDHVFKGHERPGLPSGSGYHYRPGGKDWPGRRLKPGTSVTKDPATGAYRGQPQFWDHTTNPPGWKNKAGNGGESSFFPDHWPPQKVDAAIAGAFHKGTPVPGTNKWRGTYDGVTIEGFYDGQGGYTHGWPIVP